MSITNNTILEETFRKWTDGKGPVQARISIYEKVRDIPYAIIPELMDGERYIEILTRQQGSCTPKHFLLCEMFRRLGLLVLFSVYPFWWGERAEVLDDYSTQLKKMADRLPMSHHLACRVEIDGSLVLVDATLDLPLEKVGLPVNRHWDGFSDTLVPMVPCGEDEIYHPSEAHLLVPHSGQQWLEFYAELNRCFKEVRCA